MGTPMSYTDLAKEVLTKLEVMDKRLVKIAKQVEEIYNDDFEQDNVEQIEEPFDRPDDETIKRLGYKVAYNLIEDPIDVQNFKDWIYLAKSNPRLWNEDELKYIDIADKNFKDIRLSRKHLNILQTAYPKISRGPWPFKSIQGYMWKYGVHIAWEWFRQ